MKTKKKRPRTETVLLYMYITFGIGMTVGALYHELLTNIFIIVILALIGFVILLLFLRSNSTEEPAVQKQKIAYEEQEKQQARIKGLTEFRRHLNWDEILDATVSSKNQAIHFEGTTLRELIAGKPIDGHIITHDSQKISWNPKNIRRFLVLLEYLVTSSNETVKEMLKCQMERFQKDYSFPQQGNSSHRVLQNAFNEYYPTMMKILKEERKI